VSLPNLSIEMSGDPVKVLKAFEQLKAKIGELEQKLRQTRSEAKWAGETIEEIGRASCRERV